MEASAKYTENRTVITRLRSLAFRFPDSESSVSRNRVLFLQIYLSVTLQVLHSFLDGWNSEGGCGEPEAERVWRARALFRGYERVFVPGRCADQARPNGAPGGCCFNPGGLKSCCSSSSWLDCGALLCRSLHGSENDYCLLSGRQFTLSLLVNSMIYAVTSRKFSIICAVTVVL